MILSKSHGFIFLKTTKTAGTSFEIALSRYLSQEDVVTPISKPDEETRLKLGYQGPTNYLLPVTEYAWRDYIRAWLGKPPKKFWNHIPAKDARERVGSDTWGKFLKCSIVRNPFDYAVSRYYWSNQSENKSVDGFRRWLLGMHPTLTLNRDITHIGESCAVDLMIRFEYFEEDIARFASETGLPESLCSEFRGIKAKGSVRPKAASAAEMFDGFHEGTKLINDLFEEDIRSYGYSQPRAD